jgi:hypothetical protein
LELADRGSKPVHFPIAGNQRAGRHSSLSTLRSRLRSQ